MQFTWADIRGIQRQILARLKRAGDKHTVAVGFGVKNAHRRPRRRVPAVILMVTRKLPPHKLTKAAHMGKARRVRVKVGRGRSTRWVTLATDVVIVPAAIPTAGYVRIGVQEGSAAAALWWRDAMGKASWGILTAGHVVSGQPGRALITLPHNGAVSGNVVVAPQRGDSMDVAVIQVDDATAAAWAPAGGADPPSVRLRNFAAMQSDVASNVDRGVCNGYGRSVPFDTEVALPGPVNFVDTLPGLRCLLQVRALAGGFFRGTSGSPCVEVLQNSAMGIVVGAQSSDFAVGYIQSMSEVLDFVRHRLRATNLRLVQLL